MSFRLWLAGKISPPTHRIIEVEWWCDTTDISTATLANDLVRGGDALQRGWGCDPIILYNGANRLRDLAATQSPRQGTLK